MRAPPTPAVQGSSRSAVRPSRRTRRPHRLRRRVRALALRALRPLAPAGDTSPPDLSTCRRVLLVHVNFRLGNTLLTTPAVAALRSALPRAELDFVGGPAAPAVLDGLGLRRVVGLRRRDVRSPRTHLGLVRELRRARYDLAIHVGTSTGSLGAFLTGVSGARHRVGCRRGSGNVFFTSALSVPEDGHRVDRLLAYLRALGVPAREERTLRLRPEEIAAARERLGARPGSAVAVFPSGRRAKGKSWRLSSLVRIAQGLRAAGLLPVVFVGPEERRQEERIRAALGPALYVFEPDLRRLAALVACCSAAVTPDAGPMHLAIAVGTPTVALFRRSNFQRWGPRPHQGEIVFDPEGRAGPDALDAVLRLVSARERRGSDAPG